MIKRNVSTTTAVASRSAKWRKAKKAANATKIRTALWK